MKRQKEWNERHLHSIEQEGRKKTNMVPDCEASETASDFFKTHETELPVESDKEVGGLSRVGKARK